MWKYAVVACNRFQNAMRVRHFVFCSLPGPATFFNESHKGMILGKNLLNICFEFLCTFCLKHFLILRRNELDTIKKSLVAVI